MRSSQAEELHRDHIRMMQELEEPSYKRGKQKSSWLSFHLSSHSASCSTTPQGESNDLLPCLVRMTTSITSIWSTCQCTPGWENSHPQQPLPGPVPKQSPQLKRQHPLPEWVGEHVYRWNFPKGHAGRTIQFQETGHSHLVCLTQTQPCRGLQPRLWHCERSQVTFLFPITLATGSMTAPMTFLMSSRN